MGLVLYGLSARYFFDNGDSCIFAIIDCCCYIKFLPMAISDVHALLCHLFVMLLVFHPCFTYNYLFACLYFVSVIFMKNNKTKMMPHGCDELSLSFKLTSEPNCAGEI